MVVLENPESEKQDSTTSKFKIKHLTLESNCNNEIKSFQFDPMPSCVTDKCNTLLCKPLNEVGIDVEKINTSSVELLGEGQFNKVYDITYDENNPIVLRLLRKDRTDYKTVKQEQNGLVYQTRVSKSNKDGGYDCPYIAKVYDFGIYDDEQSYNRSVYAILEKCKMDLFDKMSELDGAQKSITEQQLKNITKQTLEALHCLHEHKIYHLDLKPENIMYNDVENVSDIKLIDFGAALQSQGPEKDLLSSKYFGTPGYISPAKLHRVRLEKTHKLNSPNAMDDLWSLGITLMKLIFITYEMTTERDYLFSKFPHNPNVVPRNYYDYNADVLVPTEKAYEEILETTLPDFTTGFSPECVAFLRRIFETVSIENNKVILRDSYLTLSAKDLLEDSWLKSKGGKRRTKRKNKKTAKHKRRKSKNKRKRSSKKH
tara:strand:- start:818 stop:2101 length:1284 start_codon:yes stop_codon:yes gene_type:complete